MLNCRPWVIVVFLFSVLVAFPAGADTVKYSDDFSGDLSGWVSKTGTWNIQSGRLLGYWDISAGGVWDAQGVLLLADTHQPTASDWKMEVDFTYLQHEGYTYYQSMASFCLYIADDEKETYSVGFAGDSWNGSPRSDASWSGGIGLPWSSLGNGSFSINWDPKGTNHAIFQKAGNQYSIFMNGLLAHTWTGTSLAGAPKLGLHIYGSVLVDNFRLTELGTSSKSITVTKPVGGETFTRGQSIEVNWTTVGVMENVRIRLDYPGYSGIIVSSTVNDGVEWITIPVGYQERCDWMAAVTDTELTVGDFSPAFCIGQTGCYLTCTSSASPASGIQPLTVTYMGNATPSAGCVGSPSYSWDFGDGTSSTLQNPTHTYTVQGNYTWTFTATIGDSHCSQTGTVTVIDGGPAAVLAIGEGAGAPGGGACVNLSLTNNGSPVITALTTDITYDPAALTPSGATTSVGGKLVDWSVISAGRVRVTLFGGTGVLADGTVASVCFTVAAGASGTYTLNHYAGTPTASDTNANPVSISGTGGSISTGRKAGDCNGDGTVSITELMKVVNCQLARPSCDGCGDCDNDGTVSITEVMKAVNCQLERPNCQTTCIH